MNGYARLNELKTDLRIGDSTSFDDTLNRLIESVSRGFDDQLGRHFYDVTATRDFDVVTGDDLVLELDADVVSISSLLTDTDGDGVYETTIASTDYALLPTTSPPRRFIEHDSTYWPVGHATVRVAGRFGYSYEADLLTATVQNNPLTNSGTSLTVASGHGISVGETIVLESEQVYVSAAVNATTLTIVRGINGTTAAQHAQGVAIYRRRYPRPIEQATAMQVVRLWRDLQSGFSGQAGNSEFGYSFSTLFPAIRDLVAPYRVAGGIA